MNGSNRSTLNRTRRRKTRHATCLGALLTSGTRTNSAVITNLSESGLQLECDRQCLDDLMPNIQKPDPNKPIELQVMIEVPPKSSGDVLTLHCTMLYVRRLAQNRFLVGGAFSTLENHQLPAFNQLLHSAD